MPYDREQASKTGHSSIARDPAVKAFLDACNYMREPDNAEAAAIASQFHAAPAPTENLPHYVLASDGSKADVAIQERLPSTRMGFIKISLALIDMQDERKVRTSGRFVNPMQVADLEKRVDHISVVLPGSNVRYKGLPSVRDGFRAAIHDKFSAIDVPDLLTLADALVKVQPEGTLRLEQCAECGDSDDVKKIVFTKGNQVEVCPTCRAALYPSDFLRLHAGVTEEGDSTAAVTRTMNAIEQLLLVRGLLIFWEGNPRTLSNAAFVFDGPLSLSGEPARLQSRIQLLIARITADLASRGLQPPLILGLQKTGALADHANLIRRHIPSGMVKLVDDDYRSRYVREVTADNFGHYTHYGQDFIFKTESGRIFVFGIPYPQGEKGPMQEFRIAKADITQYTTLARACEFIRHFETDLYDNALIPVALAHRHASISLRPGNRVLEDLVRMSMRS